MTRFFYTNENIALLFEYKNFLYFFSGTMGETVLLTDGAVKGKINCHTSNTKNKQRQ